MNLYMARPRRLEWAALVGILVLAAVLRLGASGLVEFWRDEANLSERALNMVHGREFPLLGIDTSVGIPSGPVGVYILAIPYLFNSNPLVATQFIGVVNVIAVGLAYGLARRYYGPSAAIAAGFLLAISPWNVLYSRRLWQPDMLPLFALLTVGTGLLGFVEGKRWAQLIHLPLLALTGQIHYVTFTLIPITLYLLWIGCRHLTRMFALSLLLTLLVVTPYAVGLARQGLVSVESFQKVIAAGIASSGDKRAVVFSDAALRDAEFLIAGTNLVQMVGPQSGLDFLVATRDIAPLLNILAWNVAAAALWLIFRAVCYRDARTPVDLAFVIWLVCTPAAFLFTWTRLNAYYFNPMLPAAFIVLGIAVHDLWQALAAKIQVRRVVFAAGSVALLVLGSIQIWLIVLLFSFIATQNTADGVLRWLNEFLVGFTTPLGYYMPIRDAILEQHPQNVLAKLDGQFVGFHTQTTAWNVLLYDVPSVRFLDADTDVYPAEPAVYLSHECTAATLNFYLRPGEPCYTVGKRGRDDLDLSVYNKTNEATLTFANKARIVAYQWDSNKGALSIVWTINGPAPKEDFGFFVHFINSRQEEIINADDFSWRGRYWRDGDTVVKRFYVKNHQDLKSEIAGVRVGMYLHEDTPDGPKFYNQDLYDKNGGVAGQFIEINLLK